MKKDSDKIRELMENMPEEELEEQFRILNDRLDAMTQEERTEFFADAFFGTGPETEGIRRKIRDVAGEAPEDLRPDVLRSLAKEVSRLFEPDDRPGRMSSAQRACKDFELLMDQMMEQAMRGGPYTVAIDVAAAEKSQTSLLGKCSRKDLENYCKYLGIGLNGSEKRERMAELVYNELQSHPGYFLYGIDAEEAKQLLYIWNSFRKRKGIAVIPVEAIKSLIQLGYIELNISKIDGKDTAVLGFTDELVKGLNYAVSGKAKGKYSSLETMCRRTEGILMLYGMIEIEALYDVYSSNFGSKVTFNDYVRFLYWHMRMHDKVITGNIGDKKAAFAAAPGIDWRTAGRVILEDTSDLEYKSYSKNEIMEASREGLNAVSEAVRVFEEVIEPIFPLLEDRVEVMNFLLPELVSGRSMTDLMEDLDEYRKDGHFVFDQGNVILDAYIWHAGMRLIMEIGLAGLKGYSRKEYLDMDNELPEDLSIFRVTRQQKQNVTPFRARYKGDTRLQDMPESIQLQIYEALADGRSRESAGRLEAIRKLYGDNAAIMVLESDCMLHVEDVREAIDLIRKASYLLPRSKAEVMKKLIEETEREYGVGNGSKVAGPVMTERAAVIDPPRAASGRSYEGSENRTRIKIGRNDPCPCGSGKKYKNCCGKA